MKKFDITITACGDASHNWHMKTVTIWFIMVEWIKRKESELSITCTVICLSFIGDSKPEDHEGT